MEALIQVFIAYSTVLFILMSCIWTTKDFINLSIKCSLFLFAILGVIIELKHYNFI